MRKVNPEPQSQTTEKMSVGSNVVSSRKPPKLTKKARLIRLLSKDAGADVAGISRKFGWLPHTTRATLSGLRKAGYEISSVKSGNGKPSKYHITGVPSEHNAQ